MNRAPETVTISKDTAVILLKVFLPSNPNKLRNRPGMSGERLEQVRKACHDFMTAIDGAVGPSPTVTLYCGFEIRVREDQHIPVEVLDPRYTRPGYAIYKDTSLDRAMRWVDAYQKGEQWAVDAAALLKTPVQS